jgi:predicted secreted protein
MQWSSIIAIYVLFWTMCLFAVLPFHARTAEEVGTEKVPGQADSAPHRFRAGSVILWTTMVSAALFGLYYANYVYGWIGPDLFDWVVPRVS